MSIRMLFSNSRTELVYNGPLNWRHVKAFINTHNPPTSNRQAVYKDGVIFVMPIKWSACLKYKPPFKFSIHTNKPI